MAIKRVPDPARDRGLLKFLSPREVATTPGGARSLDYRGSRGDFIFAVLRMASCEFHALL